MLKNKATTRSIAKEQGPLPSGDGTSTPDASDESPLLARACRDVVKEVGALAAWGQTSTQDDSLSLQCITSCAGDHASELWPTIEEMLEDQPSSKTWTRRVRLDSLGPVLLVGSGVQAPGRVVMVGAFPQREALEKSCSAAVSLMAQRLAESLMSTQSDLRHRGIERSMLRQKRLATAGAIASTVAHEIRNSATSTKLFLQLLEERPGLDPRDEKSLAVALRSISRMERVLDNLVRLARPDRVWFEQLDLVKVLEAAVELARVEASRRRLNLRVELPSSEVMIHGEKGMLLELFLHLLNNANQAYVEVPKGAVIQVRLVIDDKGEGLLRPQPAAVIEIDDNGAGIPARVRGRIFESFFTTRENGTGLGLPTSQRIAREHRGQLSVEPLLPTGTRVRVTIPTGVLS